MSRRSEYRFTDDESMFDVSAFRDRTLTLLRRYARVSVALGHLPVALGQEFFRARVSSSKAHTFEDAVIFSLDVERCLAKLDATARQVLVRVTVQNYTHREAARLMHWPEWRFERCFAAAVDDLSRILLECRMLHPGAKPPRSQPLKGIVKGQKTAELA